MNNKKIHIVTFLLLVIGGVNWGLEGLFNWGIGAILPYSIAKIIYILVGVAAVYELFTHKATCKMCEAKPATRPADTGGM